MQLKGILIGLISFLSIGLFHPLVIKGEYYFSKNIWPVFGIFGTIMLAVSLKVKNIVISAGAAVIGMSSFWSIKELYEQEQRVERGWFPRNPNRKQEVNLMKPIDTFKKFRDDYVIRQVEKAKLPDFEDDYFVRRRVTFHGRVQHVGFRLELEQMATRLGLTGWVKNLEDGGVLAEIQGYESRIRYILKFMRSLKRIKIEKMENKPCSPKQNETAFKII